LNYLVPNWPPAPGLHAYSTLRAGGFSQAPFAGCNLGAHVGDDPEAVAANRRLLRESLRLPAEPCWLNQVHGARAAPAETAAGAPVEADAAYACERGAVCVVMTADCLPVLFRDRAGTRVAAAHAGWRGLAGGVLEATANALGGSELMAWLGPAIGPAAFEVGAEVRQAFLDKLGDCQAAFRPADASHWLADLYLLARLTLARAGVTEVYGGDSCTHADPARFFSHRRDGGRTGRMATLIWRE
jgi:YfiH family protein